MSWYVRDATTEAIRVRYKFFPEISSNSFQQGQSQHIGEPLCITGQIERRITEELSTKKLSHSGHFYFQLPTPGLREFVLEDMRSLLQISIWVFGENGEMK